MESQPFNSIGEAAEKLNVPEAWLRREISAGRLPGVLTGGRWRVCIDQLRAAIAERAAAPVVMRYSREGSP